MADSAVRAALVKVTATIARLDDTIREFSDRFTFLDGALLTIALARGLANPSESVDSWSDVGEETVQD